MDVEAERDELIEAMTEIRKHLMEMLRIIVSLSEETFDKIEGKAKE